MKNIIKKILSEETGNKLTKIYNSWINKQAKGSILKEHTHPAAILSGALYLNVDNQFIFSFSYNDAYYKELEQIFTLINNFVNILSMLIDESIELSLILDLITKL